MFRVIKFSETLYSIQSHYGRHINVRCTQAEALKFLLQLGIKEHDVAESFIALIRFDHQVIDFTAQGISTRKAVPSDYMDDDFLGIKMH